MTPLVIEGSQKARIELIAMKGKTYGNARSSHRSATHWGVDSTRLERGKPLIPNQSRSISHNNDKTCFVMIKNREGSCSGLA